MKLSLHEYQHSMSFEIKCNINHNMKLCIERDNFKYSSYSLFTYMTILKTSTRNQPYNSKQFPHHFITSWSVQLLFIFPRCYICCHVRKQRATSCTTAVIYTQILLGNRNKNGSNPRRFLVLHIAAPSFIFLLSCPRSLSCH